LLLLINTILGRISYRFRETAIYSLKRFIENCCQTAADGDLQWLLLTTYRKLPPPIRRYQSRPATT